MSFAATASIKLYSRNNPPIKTYGRQIIKLCLNLCREFKQTFVVAYISKPTNVAEFLKPYGLLSDLKKSCLREPLTYLSNIGRTVNSKDRNTTSIALLNLVKCHCFMTMQAIVSR